jgi:hypothetical protein
MGGAKMRAPGFALAVAMLSVALSISTSPAIASGKHISCEMSGTITDGNGRHTRTHYTLRFYLDETHAQLVGDGADGPLGPTNLNVRTESYSDTQITGGISTEINDMWFDLPTDGNTAFMIQRQTGTAWVLVKLLPNGAEAKETLFGKNPHIRSTSISVRVPDKALRDCRR